MSERLEDHIDEYLPLRVTCAVSGHQKEKRIFRLRDDELGGLRKLGGASVPFIGMAINTAFNRVPDFYDRVVGYRLCNDRIAEMAQEVLKEPYFTIEFFELDVPLPPPRRAEAERAELPPTSAATRATRPSTSPSLPHQARPRPLAPYPRRAWVAIVALGTATGADLADAFRQGTLGIPEFAERVAGYRFDGKKLRSFTAEEPLIRYVSVTFYELAPE